MVVIIITTTTNIIIRMRECVWTNIYGQIESVLTRQEPLCPNPYAADSFLPEKKWIAYICTSLFIHFIYIMCDEVKNIYIHKCTSEHWEKYTTSSLSVVQNGLYCFAAVLNDKPTIWQVPAVCESFAKSVTRRQEAKSKVGWLHEICKQTMNVNLKVTFQFPMLNIYLCYRTLFFVGKLFENTMGRISDTADKASNF